MRRSVALLAVALASSAPGGEAAGPLRVGTLTGLRPEKAGVYRKLHANPWPEVLRRLRRSNLRNYSIYVKEIDGRPILFSFFEHRGRDFAADCARMAADPDTQRWWKETDPCQEPLPRAAARKQIWDDMEEVFFDAGAVDVKAKSVRRMAAVTGLKPDREELYRTLHATTWPGVLKQNRESNFRNFSIFLKDIGGKLYLFYYLEYVGGDLDADMKTMAENPVVQRWWALTDDCQVPLPDAPVDAAGKKGPWAPMEEIFHAD